MENQTKAKVAAGISAAALAIISAVVSLEQGYVNHPDDPGGETNFGITKVVAVQNGYNDPMKLLPKELATKIYYQDYIVKPGFLPLVEIQPAVAEEVIDSGVNTGPATASRWFQEALNALSQGGKNYPLINVDGKVGPASIRAYQSLEKARGRIPACELMIKLLDARQANYYISLNKPMFISGWIAHRIGNVPLTKCTLYSITAT